MLLANPIPIAEGTGQMSVQCDKLIGEIMREQPWTALSYEAMVRIADAARDEARAACVAELQARIVVVEQQIEATQPRKTTHMTAVCMALKDAAYALERGGAK